jgi:hypothetical protein
VGPDDRGRGRGSVPRRRRRRSAGARVPGGRGRPPNASWPGPSTSRATARPWGAATTTR